MLDKLTLGEFIKVKRELLGYGKIEFSKMLGVGDDTLRSWERNRFRPAGKNKDLLIKFLQLSNDEIDKFFYYKRLL